MYYALQTVEDKMVVVTVYITDDDTPTASFIPARALDFWGICWERDTYNIWTQSADIGTFCFEFFDGKWVRNSDMECPDYIISRYNAQYRDNADLKKDMYISPTD